MKESLDTTNKKMRGERVVAQFLLLLELAVMSLQELCEKTTELRKGPSPLRLLLSAHIEAGAQVLKSVFHKA
jgi:hypothetical protein